jgi:hypothetical protein
MARHWQHYAEAIQILDDTIALYEKGESRIPQLKRRIGVSLPIGISK